MADLPATMRGVLLTGHGDADKLDIRGDIPVPVPGPGASNGETSLPWSTGRFLWNKSARPRPSFWKSGMWGRLCWRCPANSSVRSPPGIGEPKSDNTQNSPLPEKGRKISQYAFFSAGHGRHSARMFVHPGNHPVDSDKNRTFREMPSRFIFEFNVLVFRPKSSAAPSFPLTL